MAHVIIRRQTRGMIGKLRHNITVVTKRGGRKVFLEVVFGS
jgi:hypothetical protein